MEMLFGVFFFGMIVGGGLTSWYFYIQLRRDLPEHDEHEDHHV